MTRKKAKNRLAELNSDIERALNEWNEACDELEHLQDKRDRFIKRHKKLLPKRTARNNTIGWLEA